MARALLSPAPPSLCRALLPAARSFAAASSQEWPLRRAEAVTARAGCAPLDGRDRTAGMCDTWLSSRGGFWGFRGMGGQEKRGVRESVGLGLGLGSELGLGLGLQKGGGVRTFKSGSILCMGRRSSKIAMRKGAQDARKSKLYGKIGKQIISAVKTGGPSPASNTALALLLSQARLYDIPKDILERNIKKASEKGQADFAELNYEVYGLGGVGIVLDVLTDNNARAAANVRDVVKKNGGKMADPGSVMFNFKRCGVIALPAEKIDPDELLLTAMDAGADDVREPEEAEEEEQEESRPMFKVLTSMESFVSVRSNLEEANFPIDFDHSGLELIPVAYVEPDDEARELNDLIMEKLLELDDVDAVYSNQK